ncbi:hypothetical protein OPV22_007088 [Ensete ventricosum]|uniref:Uncharacterized protein n=1 Tax=Ensete ventricosum TaxID=4639 RepID=A0AAV8Q633_ENSVE|nr:hypothetical protein OPV22_007088 [Ensete ventricosum]
MARLSRIIFLLEQHEKSPVGENADETKDACWPLESLALERELASATRDEATVGRKGRRRGMQSTDRGTLCSAINCAVMHPSSSTNRRIHGFQGIPGRGTFFRISRLDLIARSAVLPSLLWFQVGSFSEQMREAGKEESVSVEREELA